MNQVKEMQELMSKEAEQVQEELERVKSLLNQTSLLLADERQKLSVSSL